MHDVHACMLMEGVNVLIPRLRTDLLREKAEEVGDSTHYAIAQRAGVRESTISRLLAGCTTPTLQTLWALGAAYSIPLNDLLEPGEVEVPA